MPAPAGDRGTAGSRGFQPCRHCAGKLTHSFDAIGSCLSLLGARDVALRDRVALDLIRTEVFRAGRLVQCLRVVSKDPPVSAVPVSLTRVVEQVLESFARVPAVRRPGGRRDQRRRAPGPRRSRSARRGRHRRLRRHAGARAVVAPAIAPGPGRFVAVRVLGAAGDRATARVAPGLGGRPFFDLDWTDRPGGYQAAAELAAARRITGLHHGGMELVAGEGGGCRLVVLLPTA